MLTIKITGETPLEALASLTAFGIHCMANNDVAAAATRNSDTPADLKTSPPPTDPPAEPYVEDPPHGDPAPKSEPEGAAEAGGGAGEDDTPTYTLEQIRARGTEAARVHGTPAVKAVLTELGAKGMGTLDKSKYSAFMAKLDELDKAKAGDPDA